MSSKYNSNNPIITETHHIYFNKGGLIIARNEDIEDADFDEEGTPTIAQVCRHVGVTLLAPHEVMAILNLIAPQREKIRGNMNTLQERFTELASVWLGEYEAYEREKGFLEEREKHWWPAVRNNANHCMNFVTITTNSGYNPFLTAWMNDARQNAEFPLSQQQELLTRHFKRLYAQKYPLFD